MYKTTDTSLSLSGVSRISARGVLKVRSDTKSVCGGVGVGGALCFRSDTKSGGLCLAHSKYVIVNNERLQFWLRGC